MLTYDTILMRLVMAIANEVFALVNSVAKITGIVY